MNSLTLAAQKIKDCISAQDVGEALGLEIRRGRCQCPIHGGHDFNCVLYRGDRGYFCHVCHAGGDVISFVQQYYKTSFKDSVSWLNATFNLGIDLDAKIDPQKQREAEKALQERKRAREQKEWADRMQYNLALTASRIVDLLEEQRDRNTPKTVGEAWDPQFCEAIRLLPGARRFAENCWYACMDGKK